MTNLEVAAREVVTAHYANNSGPITCTCRQCQSIKALEDVLAAEPTGKCSCPCHVHGNTCEECCDGGPSLNRASEPSGEQKKVAEDVHLYGVGFAMHTPGGVQRLDPKDVTFNRPPENRAAEPSVVRDSRNSTLSVEQIEQGYSFPSNPPPEPKATQYGRFPHGTKVVLLGSLLPGSPTHGWKIETIDEPRPLKYRIRHANGSLLDVIPELIAMDPSENRAAEPNGPHTIFQDESGWEFHQWCECSPCRQEYNRRLAAQNRGEGQ